MSGRGPAALPAALDAGGRETELDLVAAGRSSIDLYSSDIGAPFAEITGFAAFVGGCPTNISVGARRLGLRTALLTAVGDDLVGEFVLRFLGREGVDVRHVPVKPGFRTSAVLLGIEPPDRFPLVFYRDRPPDLELTIDDVLAAPLDRTRAFLFTGTGLSREPSRSATLVAAERARRAGAAVLLDIDFRPDQWHDPRAFGVSLRGALPLCDIAIGTESEVKAVVLERAADVAVAHSQISGAEVGGDLDRAVAAVLERGPRALVVKRGPGGASVHLPGQPPLVAAPFPVEPVNVLGAGDAFAAGLLYGLVRGWDWQRSARMGNACGAIVVTRHGCANFMPTEREALDFVAARGGF
ncbi:MAG TPA: 5-dehydro-2-deoxygluconokinase [Kofleriaceae bacterium]|nr:5-dehydro-2-deoxygluconokinase [Kofleriaceae bacterium]